MEGDLFWDIEIQGQAHNDTTWLVPTAEDDLTQKDSRYNKTFRLARNHASESKITIHITPIRDTGVLDIIGGELWEACFYLCAYILQRPQFFCDRTVLELGAGLGLPGLLIAQLKTLFKMFSIEYDSDSAVDVCLTDNALELLDHLSATVAAMGGRETETGIEETALKADESQVSVSVKHLDWQAYVDISDCDWTLKPMHPEELLSAAHWDVIIGSALVYSPSHASVAFVLRHFLASPRCKEVVIIQIRDRPGFSNFLQRLESLGLRYEISPVDARMHALASKIKVASKGVEKVFEFSVPTFDTACDGVDSGESLSAQSSRESSSINSDSAEHAHNSSSCESILTTDPSTFAILRIRR